MSETILVVDDEENIRHTLRGVLADEGFEVLEAPDGRRALELLQHAAPRLAIVDVWMPEMDGIELVERMRNQAPGVPIIVISGHGTIETAVRVIRLGAFDFLEKPFPLDALLSVVGRALGTNAAAAETAALAAAGPAPSLAPARRFPERTIGRSVLVNGRGTPPATSATPPSRTPRRAGDVRWRPPISSRCTTSSTTRRPSAARSTRSASPTSRRSAARSPRRAPSASSRKSSSSSRWASPTAGGWTTSFWWGRRGAGKRPPPSPTRSWAPRYSTAAGASIFPGPPPPAPPPRARAGARA